MKRRRIERWKPIPDTNELYWISSKGKVHSRKHNKIHLLKPKKTFKSNRNGSRDNCHLRVTIYYNDGSNKKELIHRLVGLLFVPNPNNYPQINHKDGIKANNYYKNLEWGTQSMNMIHAYHTLGHKQLLNTNRKGTNNNASKLTDEDVKDIRHQLATTKTRQKDLAKQYNVTRYTINAINTNKRWTHI